MVRLSVAIPDSALSEHSTKLDKSRMVSQMARCAAVFGIDAILVYRDGDNVADRSLLVTTLRYLETPQFLRRSIFPKTANLRFAGALQPLGIPSHDASPDPRTIREGGHTGRSGGHRPRNQIRGRGHRKAPPAPRKGP